MDYKTFCDAHRHNKRELYHLLNLLSTRIDQTAEFSLFLGAGASKTSGVKSRSEMISDWRRMIYSSYKGKHDFKVWLKQQEWYGAEDEYSHLFELVYDQPSLRRAYIEKAVCKAKPNLGYIYLASLIEAGIFNIIFTTNFDDLLSDAFFYFGNNLRPIVCTHDSSVSSVRLISDRPKIVKLHGDFLYESIKNTSSEVQSLEKNMRDKFIEFAKEFGLVVVGYTGKPLRK